MCFQLVPTLCVGMPSATLRVDHMAGLKRWGEVALLVPTLRVGTSCSLCIHEKARRVGNLWDFPLRSPISAARGFGWSTAYTLKHILTPPVRSISRLCLKIGQTYTTQSGFMRIDLVQRSVDNSN